MDDKNLKYKIESATLRRLIKHLQENTDLQNIDLMNLAGFCRNCLSKWYAQASNEAGVELDKEAAREIIYGMPYDEWKMRYQLEATPEQQAAFAAQQASSTGE